MKSFATLLRSKFVITNFLLAVCFLFSVNGFGQATVQTDKPDYHPGDTAWITGSGFWANETVTLKVTHVPPLPGEDTLASHQPWDITADASGNINAYLQHTSSFYRLCTKHIK